jgi:hypothetical protein
MQPIRQIYQNAPSSISIPEELRHQAVEVIIWPLDEQAHPKTSTETDANGWPIGFFEATAGCLADDPIERAPQGEYETRLELE